MPVQTEYRAICAYGSYWNGYCQWRSGAYSTKTNAALALKLHRSEEHR